MEAQNKSLKKYTDLMESIRWMEHVPRAERWEMHTKH